MKKSNKLLISYIAILWVIAILLSLTIFWGFKKTPQLEESRIMNEECMKENRENGDMQEISDTIESLSLKNESILPSFLLRELVVTPEENPARRNNETIRIL